MESGVRPVDEARFTGAVTVSYAIPTATQLSSLARRLSMWQADPWVGHLHPGDLGWHSSVGVDQMTRDLRVWERNGVPVAIGMLDGSDVLRLAVDPKVTQDHALAERIAADLNRPGTDLFTGTEAVVEARGAVALRRALISAAWVEDEPWTPMTLALDSTLDLGRLDHTHLRVVNVGSEAAGDWTGVHWSSFKGTPFDEESRARFVDRWTQIMTGPFADNAHSLIGYDATGSPVAITTVWTAGPGRPGLVEPMGVHRVHHGRGYGVAITLAGARALREHGASSAVVVAENSNPAAIGTYRSAGFVTDGPITDLKRP